ncbi:DNA/RNA nuclease SfsA [Halioglobus maricola]|uniref:Sugar fermentation stimulation protein homolog n=1 Tax=Halioglobus maricola TaxID=2601894 RepID=A0A5P9NQ00_9GAMM|nr:DNA/RNA nuclease SfsA [Halioglobus maricola]
MIEGVLIKRYKRFLADVQLSSGEVITVHCPNTGAMTGCAEPGWKVWLSRSDSKTRKYPHTWELVETDTGMACIHSARANKLVKEAFAVGRIPGFSDYPEIRTEVKYGEGSRADLVLEGDPGKVFVEVKSVTLCPAGGQGLFPDAVSDRGRKHLRELRNVLAPDTRAVMFFCALHEGVDHVSAAGEIDPRYRDTLAEVVAAGVEVLAWGAKISPEEMRVERPLGFSVDPL